jgi:hypothetical protein
MEMVDMEDPWEGDHPTMGTEILQQTLQPEDRQQDNQIPNQ